MEFGIENSLEKMTSRLNMEITVKTVLSFRRSSQVYRGIYA
jgi:hypothetical protein